MNARVRLVGQAREEYEALKKKVKEEKGRGTGSSENSALLKSIDQKIELLKQNPLYGEVIKGKEIPKELDADNLFKVRLAGFWRMLYTIRRHEIEIFCFILIIEPHKHYDKRFKGKKKP